MDRDTQDPPLRAATVAVRFLFFVVYFLFIYSCNFFSLFMELEIRDLGCNLELRSMNI